MENGASRAIAIVGAGALLPDAPNVAAFWENIKGARYSITEVTPDRWDPAYYYDPDPGAPDKTYSKIGGWVRTAEWEPLKWKLPIPPRVAAAMDGSQKWAIACTREALADYGYPDRTLDTNRTAVILGNALGGEQHYFTVLRICFPEYAHVLAESSTFAALPAAVQRDITREFHDRVARLLPEITEDTMPGELANCVAGRVANLYNFRGPNYTADAACASAMAAICSAAEGLIQGDFDVAITGGVDRNMGASSFVKFCKIGALSATGSRPYAEGADGFVMGEGAAVFLMKRLADAERDQDRIYAVLRGIGASSDGRGKGITAPNPIGQKLCIKRAWQNAGLSPATATLIEGHGTSTRVGDAVETQSLIEVLGGCDLPARSVALGSVKSNIGHLKAASASAGFLKTVLALRDKVLPPSVNCERPSSGINFDHAPVYVNTELRPWDAAAGGVRRAGVSAFGFGGTNFHAVLEEYIPGTTAGNGKRSIAVSQAPPVKDTGSNGKSTHVASPAGSGRKLPLRGALVVGAESAADLAVRLRAIHEAALEGRAPAPAAPDQAVLRLPERIAIDYADASDLADRSSKALRALASNESSIWKALRSQGVFRGAGPAPKVAFLYTGQGSQYVNMLQALRKIEPVVAATFEQADRVMKPLLGKPLSDFIFVDKGDPAAIAQAEEDLRQTAITQPAVLAADIALTRLLAEYGIRPDMAMGHSLGEYGALVASGALPFEDALGAVSARGSEMTRVALEDNGKMAAIFAPYEEIERILQTVNGYVVIANINSRRQAVIGGTSRAVDEAVEVFLKAGFNAVPLQVSHAFHTSIVAPASGPFRKVLERMRLESPRLPIVANENGEFYPMGPGVAPRMLDILTKQISSPVQFIKGLETLYQAGARVFVEVGPKKALQGFADEVLGERPDVLALMTNHPKFSDDAAFNQALCGLYAAGLGCSDAKQEQQARSVQGHASRPLEARTHEPAAPTPLAPKSVVKEEHYGALGKIFAEAIERASGFYASNGGPAVPAPVVVTGAALGLPGTERVFDDGNLGRMLAGEQFIRPIPADLREAMLDKHITRLVKSDNGGPVFEAIGDVADVIKLAARAGAFDLEQEFGVPAERVAALDRSTRLAMGAGLDAMRDAGIPLVLRYKTTTKGTFLPDHWGLPESMRDETGVIFAAAFPSYNSIFEDVTRYQTDRSRRDQIRMLQDLRRRAVNGSSGMADEIDRRIQDLRRAQEDDPYVMDRRFLFRILSMGHSQFAEFIGARGPNTQVNSACASTTMAVSLAEDWIRAGRCRRVIVVSADDITSDSLMDWFGAGFLASGAAATDEVVEEAATPFDRRRHGMICGMGAAALVIEHPEAARERGLRPICEVLSAASANSAFHGTRLDVEHIGGVMEKLVAEAEQRSGVPRAQMAQEMVFISHETYTPARGGSAAAEIHALRRVFGEAASRIVIANTKGFTGHAMGTGIEDVVAVKALETGWVPPVANFKEVDPELGLLNLSKGGEYPIRYALRLGAGFGSQISMTVFRLAAADAGVRPGPDQLGYAYRIADQPAWNAWLGRESGYAAPDLEVVHRTLRVRDEGVPARLAAARAEARIEPTAKPAAEALPVDANRATTVTEWRQPDGVASDSGVTAVASAAGTPPAGETAADPVKDRILALAAEKTGYPVDMLGLDLDLEADLGVDTVKQAELLAGIRAAYDIPRDDKLKLRDFPTLAHIIQFVYDRRPELAAHSGDDSNPAAPVEKAPAAPAVAPVSAAETAAAVVVDDVKERILALAAEKTGYPIDMLDLDLDLEADLGVDTVKQAEMFASVRAAFGIERDPNMRLRDFPTLAHVIRFARDRRPAATVPAQSPEVQQAADTASAVEPSSVPMSAPAAPPPAASDTPGDEAIREKVLDIVAEKTGYPKDMLDLDLDLEADLGVDTVKQAEMFASVRAAFGIERDPNLKLRDFPTLAHVIGFARERRPAASAPAQPPEAPQPAAKASAVEPSSVPTSTPTAPPPAATDTLTSEAIREKVLDIVAEKTGYPKDMLDLDLDLEADLGVDTVKQAEMFASVRSAFNIERDPNLKLRDFPTLAHVIGFARERRPAATAPAQPPETPQSAATASAVEASLVPTSAAVAPPAATDTLTNEAIREKVLEIVAEKTGYPKDMLDLELDLEADLGVDTVKQAEMFASVRAAFNIERDPDLKLRDFPTLAHVIRFARDRRSGMVATAAPGLQTSVPAVPSAPVPAPLARSAPASLDAANRVPRRVPVPILRPPLAICKLTGISLGRGARVIVMPDRGGAGEALAKRLRMMGVEVLEVATPEPDAARLQEWLAAGPITGVYWLPALDHEGNLADLDPQAWRAAIGVRLKAMYTTVHMLYDQIAHAGTFLVAATRLGGQHGYDEAGAEAPMGGAVTGFTKAYKRERPEALVKAVDFEAGCKPSQIAELLVDETLRDPGAVEIGYKLGERWTIGLQERPAADNRPGLELNENTVFLVTGAAGSIVSAITADLATASGGTFYLLDIAPEPRADDPDLKRFASDKEGLKRELFARIQVRGDRATPALVEKELQTLERQQAARSAIDAVTREGGKAYYFRVDMTDAEAVADVIRHVRERSGRIDVLLHAAGVDRSHSLKDKDRREFDLVFDVKSDGWFNLLRAIGDMPLGATVAFSSVAGRFGNGGQTDYSAANDLLCKYISSFRTTRPATRAIAIDWTAWGGIGMAARGSIPKMMELAGIETLSPEAGVTMIRRELTAGGTQGEVVIANALGALLGEWDATGGLDTEALDGAGAARLTRGPMIGRITGMDLGNGLTIETRLDPAVQPFLHDHQIGGTPVLPGVMGIEAFAEAAACMLPGWSIEAVEDVNFLAPFKFYRHEARTLTIEAMLYAEGNRVVADCRLLGSRALPNHDSLQVTVHFTGRVRLTQQAKEVSTAPVPVVRREGAIKAADIYRIYFHGPAYQVLARASRDNGGMVGQMARSLPENHRPSDRPAVFAPRLVELCFQTAGLWEISVERRMGLPRHIDSVSIWRTPERAEAPLYAVVKPAPEGKFDVVVVDSGGRRCASLTGYTMTALPDTVEAEPFKALHAAVA